jgi:hypothetical protein
MKYGMNSLLKVISSCVGISKCHQATKAQRKTSCFWCLHGGKSRVGQALPAKIRPHPRTIQFLVSNAYPTWLKFTQKHGGRRRIMKNSVTFAALRDEIKFIEMLENLKVGLGLWWLFMNLSRS